MERRRTEAPFGRIRTPFEKIRTPFGRIRTPFGKKLTPFGRIRTPFGKIICSYQSSSFSGNVATSEMLIIITLDARVARVAPFIYVNYYNSYFLPFADKYKNMPLEKSSRQSTFLNANKLINGDRFGVVRGKYLDKQIQCPNCHYAISRPRKRREESGRLIISWRVLRREHFRS